MLNMQTVEVVKVYLPSILESSSLPNRVGIFKPAYFFQYTQQAAQRRQFICTGPQAYHWFECPAEDTKVYQIKFNVNGKTSGIIESQLSVKQL